MAEEEGKINPPQAMIITEFKIRACDETFPNHNCNSVFHLYTY